MFIRELEDLDCKWNGLSRGILPLVLGERDREGALQSPEAQSHSGSHSSLCQLPSVLMMISD